MDLLVYKALEAHVACHLFPHSHNEVLGKFVAKLFKTQFMPCMKWDLTKMGSAINFEIFCLETQ